MSWFYTKQAIFTNTISALDTTTGLYGVTTSQPVTVDCDVQPLNTTKDLDETGKLIDANYKIYCDKEDYITMDSRVTYNGEEYTISKIVDWDDYLIVYIKVVK